MRRGRLELTACPIEFCWLLYGSNSSSQWRHPPTPPSPRQALEQRELQELLEQLVPLGPRELLVLALRLTIGQKVSVRVALLGLQAQLVLQGLLVYPTEFCS